MGPGNDNDYGVFKFCQNFFFKPLPTIFKDFDKPSNDKYAWTDAEEAEIIFLNGFK